MSISPLSAISTLTGTGSTSQVSSWRQSFRQLEQALASGDTSGALTAFNSLSSNTANSPFSTATNANNPLAQDLSAIGQALQSGDLASAQKSFGQLEKDFQALRSANASGQTQQTHHGRHHHVQPDSDATNPVTATSPTSNSAGTGTATSGVSILG